MRPVTLNPDNPRASFMEIMTASHENDLVIIAQGFTVTGAYTTTRSLNTGTAVLADLIAFVATFISDCQKGGQNRTT